MAYEKYLGEQIKVTVEGDLDLTKAKGVAKQKVKDIYPDAMLLSWCIGKTGEHYPILKCGASDKPAWLLYAEARGADVTIDINDGEYIFIFLTLN